MVDDVERSGVAFQQQGRDGTLLCPGCPELADMQSQSSNNCSGPIKPAPKELLWEVIMLESCPKVFEPGVNKSAHKSSQWLTGQLLF